MPRIERSWGVVADQWWNWSNNDPEADALLDTLHELGQALLIDPPRSEEARAAYDEAKNTHDRWANLNLVRSNQRNTMSTELGNARRSLPWVAPWALFARVRADWASEIGDNVYVTGRMLQGLKTNAPDALKSAGEIRGAQGQHLKIAEVNLTPGGTDAIFSKRDARSISLIKCEYPDSWHDHVFGLMPKMNRLIFFGAHGSGRPGDSLEQLSTNPAIRSLALVMTDFLHHADCYRALGMMHQLTTLTLYRTMTREKTPGFGLDSIMDALDGLIRHGDLRHLDIGHSTAFGRGEVVALSRALAQRNATLAITQNLIGGRGDDEEGGFKG